MRKLTYKEIAKRIIELDRYVTYTERIVVEEALEYVGADERDFYQFCYNLQRLYEKSREEGFYIEDVATMMYDYYLSVDKKMDILDSMKTHKLYSVVIK